MRLPLVLLCLAACTPFPALEDRITEGARAAPDPVLTPLPDLPAMADDDAAVMARRMAALQARAAAIRQIDIAALQ
ncbi:hypothetical protein [Yoonia sp.]|uniref:hypothetical protein n=1 Tax=Yoonia sp. TaxID=2212373 RepID=UPI002FD8F4AE